jgi:hypothetical protein
MNAFEFVLGILIIVFAYKVIETYIKSRSQQTKEAETTDLDAGLQALEERVRVLERIVTDERYDLKRKFKDLED